MLSHIEMAAKQQRLASAQYRIVYLLVTNNPAQLFFAQRLLYRDIESKVLAFGPFF
jgi:hypothetical protein